MSQFTIYRAEVYNFLKTMTIKFDSLAVIRNTELQYSMDIDYDDPTTWAYYQNMVGEYHDSNEMMYVHSVDTDEEIEFTKTNLALHPKTAALYRPGNNEYDLLISKYPDQADLIKSIVFPAPDIQEAIDADDFTVLAYDDSYLHANERASIIEHVRNFLYLVNKRWYVYQYEYEELFPIAFFAIVWYNLATTIFAKRMDNLRTSNVHPFHIWEYLTSKGIKDCRDILTNDQALFLYRNIDYIHRNRGKESTLIILADNLLKSLKVSIVGKTIYQSTLDSAETCMWTPEFLSDEIVDYDTNKPDISTETFESVNDMNARLYNEGLDTEHSTDYTAERTSDLASTERNILTTKLVEIEKYIIDNKYENLLLKFTLDTLIRRLVHSKVEYNISFVDNATGLSVEDLSVQDALLLLYYSIFRAQGYYPSNLPARYTAATGYYNLSRPTTYPTTFGYGGHLYTIAYYVDIPAMLDDIPYSPYKLDQDEFMDHVADQFAAMVKHILYVRQSSNRIVHKSVAKLYEQLVPTETIPINFGGEITDYPTWIASTPVISQLVTYYDALSEPKELFDELATTLWKLILPFTNEKFFKYLASIDDNSTRLYEGLKNLFVQLCSYNITFLDTQRKNALYFFLSNLAVDPHGDEELSSTTELNPFYSDYGINGNTDCPIDQEIDPYAVDMDGADSAADIDTDTDLDFDLTSTLSREIGIYEDGPKLVMDETISITTISSQLDVGASIDDIS